MTKTNSPLIEQKHAVMKSRILDKAREIMLEEGVAALSIQELARRMKMRAPSLYNYFANKMEIYDALFQLGQLTFEAKISPCLQDDSDWQTQLRGLMQSYLEFALKNPDLYQLCFERPVPGFVPSEQSLEISFGILDRLYTHVKNWLPMLNTSLNERQVTDLLISINHGITALHIANQMDISVDESRFGSLLNPALDLLSRAWEK